MKKLIAVALFSSLILTACPGGPVLDTGVRFVNAIPDSTGVNVYFGIDKVNPSLVAFKAGFPSLNSYQAIKPGSLTYSVCLEDRIPCPLPALQNKNVNLSAKPTTIYLVGTKPDSDDGGADGRPLEIVAVENDDVAPAAGKAKLRIIHAASLVAAKNVEFAITAPTDPLPIVRPTLDYKGVRPITTLDAGSYRVRATGIGSNTVLVDSGTLTLESGKIYTALIVNPDQNGQGVVLLTDK